MTVSLDDVAQNAGAPNPGRPMGSRIISGVIWTALQAWGQQAAQFIIFVVVARYLGPEALGLAVLALIAPSILKAPVVRGLSDALIQRPEITPLHVNSVFWLLAAAGFVLTFLVWILADAIAALFGVPLLADLVRCASLLIVIHAFAAVPIALLRRELAFRMLAIRTLIGTVVGGVVGCTMAFTGYGVWSLIVMQLAKAVIETTILWIGSRWRPSFDFSLARCRDLMGFASPIIGFSMWTFINDELPKTIIGLFLSPAQVGIYSLARKPLEFLTGVVLMPINAVTMPSVARLQNDIPRINRFFDSTVRIVALLGFPAFMGLAAIAPDVVPLVLGDKWSQSVIAIQIMLLLGLARTVEGIAGGIALACGHSAMVFYFNLAYTCLASVLLVFGAQFGLEVTILMVVVCNLLLLPPFLYWVWRLTRVEVLPPFAAFPRIGLATALMVAAVVGWRHAWSGELSQLALVASAIAVGVLVYACLAAVLARREIAMAYEMVWRLRKG